MGATTFTLPSGAKVTVESRRAAAAEPGPREASGVDRVAGTWADGVKLVAELAGQTVDQLREATRAAKETTVEFGVSIGGKSSIFVVEGSVEANLKVTLKW